MAVNPLEMTDEEFLKQNGPPEIPEEPTAPVAEETSAKTEEDAQNTETPSAEGTTDTEATSATPEEEAPADNSSDPVSETKDTEDTTVKPETTQEEPKTEESKEEEPKAPPMDYQSAFIKMMAPIKANGRMIEFKNPEELRQLAQMGANYTRKMQELAPHRKVLMMLQNAGLTDESKVSFAIDLINKNPEAIKKLVKDAGIDPMEIDTSVEPDYREGTHKVTDEEVVFKTKLQEYASSEEGFKTIKAINDTWDQASKDILWKDPGTLDIIHQQREAGVYDRVVAEVERLTTLGSIPAGTSFLTAYRTVGEAMTKANAFADLGFTAEYQNSGSPPEIKPAAPTVVTTRTATPKATVSNNDKAAAAASTKTTPATAKPFVNPLAMSDDEFLKQMEGRV